MKKNNQRTQKVRASEKNDVQVPMFEKLVKEGSTPRFEHVVEDQGSIDILTDNEIIECKISLTRNTAYAAVGQLLHYASFFPEHNLVIAVKQIASGKALAVALKQGISVYDLSQLEEGKALSSCKILSESTKPASLSRLERVAVLHSKDFLTKDEYLWLAGVTLTLDDLRDIEGSAFDGDYELELLSDDPPYTGRGCEMNDLVRIAAVIDYKKALEESESLDPERELFHRLMTINLALDAFVMVREDVLIMDGCELGNECHCFAFHMNSYGGENDVTCFGTSRCGFDSTNDVGGWGIVVAAMRECRRRDRTVS